MDNQADNQQPIVPTPDLAAAAEAQKNPGGLGDLHTHDGQNSPMLDPNAALLGFPIKTAVPSYAEIEGKIVLTNVGGAYGLYARIANAWRNLSGGKYGEIYLGASTKNLTCTNAGQAYLIGDANGVGTNGITGGGVTTDQGNWAVYPVAGDYKVTLTVSFSVDRTCKLTIYAHQGAAKENITSEFDVQAANKIYTVSCDGLATLTTSAVNPKVISDTAGAVITWERITLNISSV